MEMGQQEIVCTTYFHFFYYLLVPTPLITATIIIKIKIIFVAVFKENLFIYFVIKFFVVVFSMEPAGEGLL